MSRTYRNPYDSPGVIRAGKAAEMFRAVHAGVIQTMSYRNANRIAGDDDTLFYQLIQADIDKFVAERAAREARKAGK